MSFERVAKTSRFSRLRIPMRGYEPVDLFDVDLPEPGYESP